MKRNSVRWLIGVSSSVALVACGTSGTNSESTEDDVVDVAKIGDVDLSVNAMGTLALSSSIAPAVPASVTATGAGTASTSLQARDKSREACEVRQRIREAKMNQDQMAMDLCFIESQKEMKAGGKYKLTFSMPGAGLTQDFPGGEDPGGPLPGGDVPPEGEPGGEMPGGDMPTGDEPGGEFPGGEGPGGPGGMEEMSLYVFLDNSDPDEFKVFICEDDDETSEPRLVQKIVLDDAVDGGSKGRYKAKFEFGGSEVAMQGSFDNGVSEPGRQLAVSQTSFALNMGDFSTSMKSNMFLSLADQAVSIVKVANETADSGGDFSASSKELGAALIGPEYGSVLFQRTFDGEDGSFFGGPGGDEGPGGEELPPGDLPDGFELTEEQVETSRGFFDSKGQTVAKADSDKYADGGELHVTKEHMLALLPENFTVEFADTDWDCSGTEPVDVDFEADGLEACQVDFASSFSQETCDGDGFVVGFEEGEFDSLVAEREPPKDLSGDFCPAEAPLVCADGFSCAATEEECPPTGFSPDVGADVPPPGGEEVDGGAGAESL